jgi:hypothetical protein
MLSASILISYEMGPNMRFPRMYPFMILDQWPYIHMYMLVLVQLYILCQCMWYTWVEHKNRLYCIIS